MVTLRIAALVGLGACYSPDLRDCVVACSSNADCASDHVCGSDGFCATAERAGHCAELRDAGAIVGDDADAPPIDARPDAPVDAMLFVKLVVDVGGIGTVDVANLGNCSPPPACTYYVVAGAALHLVARPGNDQKFDKWDGPCSMQPATCVLTPVPPDMHVTAHFKKID
jgi:hypothetical protein